MSIQVAPHVADEFAWLAAALAAAPGVAQAEVGTDRGIGPHVLVMFTDGTRRAFTAQPHPRTGIPASARTAGGR